MSEMEVITITGLGVFTIVMCALVYIMTRAPDEGDD